MVTAYEERAIETRADTRAAWPVYWSAVWVGALTALAAVVVLGLIGVAIGAHLVGPSDRVILSWKAFGWAALIWSVASAFFAFVAAGWVATRIADFRRAEPAMLHGAIAWLVAVPLLVALMALGGGTYFGSWYGGLAGTPSWATAPAGAPAKASATTEENSTANAREQADNAARAARNSALGAVTALLLGLIGSVLGAWMASGEPMSFNHYRHRADANGATRFSRT